MEAVWDAVRWISIALGSVAGVLVVVALLGCFFPRSYTALRAHHSRRPPEDVWNVISDVAATPSWHPQVKKVERLPDRNGHEVWRESDKRGYAMQLETIEAVAPRRLVRKIADEGGPFSGQWEFDVTPKDQGGCTLTLTERGQIPNPFFRVMFWTFMSPSYYLELYLRALAVKLGDKV